jgi:hypothetical protein
MLLLMLAVPLKGLAAVGFAPCTATGHGPLGGWGGMVVAADASSLAAGQPCAGHDDGHGHAAQVAAPDAEAPPAEPSVDAEYASGTCTSCAPCCAPVMAMHEPTALALLPVHVAFPVAMSATRLSAWAWVMDRPPKARRHLRA